MSRRTKIVIEPDSDDEIDLTPITPIQEVEPAVSSSSSSSSSSSEMSNETDCNTLVDKYTDLLLTDQQNKRVIDGINFFLQKA